MTISEYIAIAFPAIFFILNPFSAAASFMALTRNRTDAEQKRTAKRACWTAFLVLLFFALCGHLIFKFFNITVPAFRIAGGIIIFSIGMNMLRFEPVRIKQTDEEMKAGTEKGDVSIVPLGIPMMSGPGAISTVMVLMGNDLQWTHAIGLITCCAVSVILIYIILINSMRLLELIKITGLGVMTRIMGLILCVIAAQFVINGIKDLLPEFARLLLHRGGV